MTIIFFFLFISLISFIANIEKYPSENGVTILTDSTFDKLINKNPYLLVLFYAPWCPHCQKFHPVYEKAAATLSKKGLTLAKVDVTVEKNVAQKYGINGLPTIFLFIKGRPIEYRGERAESDIINFIYKKLKNPCKLLNTTEEVEKFQKDNEVCIIYFGNDKNQKNQFSDVARLIEKFPFAIVEKEEIIQKLNEKSKKIVLYKQFDEKKNELTENITFDNIFEFVLKNSFEKVRSFNKKTFREFFSEQRPALILYAEKDSPKWKEYQDILKQVSIKINGEILVILSNTKDGSGAGIAKYLGISDSKLPTVRIVDTKLNSKQYELEGDINVENVYKFYEDWVNNKLDEKLKSEEIPKENNGDVFKLVGKNYRKEVIENDKDVMVYFYTTFCDECKEVGEKFAQVAKKLKNNKKLLLGQIDVTKNDVKELKPLALNFPGFKLYPGNDKDKVPLDYEGEKKIEEIIKYLKEKCYHKIEYEEDGKKEEDKAEEL